MPSSLRKGWTIAAALTPPKSPMDFHKKYYNLVKMRSSRTYYKDGREPKFTQQKNLLTKV